MEVVDIIIFGGQSNMQGQSDRLSECEEVAGALEYRLIEDSLIPLKNPVGETVRYDGTPGTPFDIKITAETLPAVTEWLNAHVIAASTYGNTNLVPSFCREYIKETKRRVVAVHVAKGSTEIKSWLPGTEGYKMILKKSHAAISKVKKKFSVGRILFVWLQGESDALKNHSKEYYKESLTTLANALKDCVCVEKFGIIRVGRFTRDDRDLEIISAQDEICAENPFFLMLTKIATDLNEKDEYMNPEAKGHFSATGLEILGKDAGASLGRQINELKI